MPSIYVPSSIRGSRLSPGLSVSKGAQPDGARYQGIFSDADYARQRAFYLDAERFPATPLRDLPGLAASLGLGRLWLKDETHRFGLPAFKGVGTTFALHSLMDAGGLQGVDTLVCASEGNHGRAVAHAARHVGLASRVYLAEGVAEARADAIRSEGATMIRVRGTYDDAVRQAAADAAAHGWQVVSDTSWEGYEEIPRQIMLGYTRIMDEAEAQWAADGPPDVILVQGGVGGLAGAVASWLAWRYNADTRPRLVIVEPLHAACIQASARAGHPVTVEGPLTTIMGGLRCGEMSPIAFPVISAVADAYVAIEDDWTRSAMRQLAHPCPPDPSLAVGTSGAAGIAALLARGHADFLASLGLYSNASAVTIATEGPTEPKLWGALTRLDTV